MFPRGRGEGGRRTHPVRLERGELLRARGGERDADLLVSASRERGKTGQDGVGTEGRAHEARPLGDDRKMSVIRGLLIASNVARAAKRRKRVVCSEEAAELPRGTHRGESQSGMGKPSESYSAPPMDEVEVAETRKASAAAKSARGVAGAVARIERRV